MFKSRLILLPILSSRYNFKTDCYGEKKEKQEKTKKKEKRKMYLLEQVSETQITQNLIQIIAEH